MPRSAISIVGLLNGEYQYSTDNSSWTNLSITNGNWDVSSLLSSSSKKVYLRKAATDSTPVTAATEITLPARPSAPNTLSVIYNDFYHPEEIIITGWKLICSIKSQQIQIGLTLPQRK